MTGWWTGLRGTPRCARSSATAESWSRSHICPTSRARRFVGPTTMRWCVGVMPPNPMLSTVTTRSISATVNRRGRPQPWTVTDPSPNVTRERSVKRRASTYVSGIIASTTHAYPSARARLRVLIPRETAVSPRIGTRTAANVRLARTTRRLASSCKVSSVTGGIVPRHRVLARGGPPGRCKVRPPGDTIET
ncbi:Uncharacterised protein [Mycobacteroides abscessus]|nr:Uncharacterised protein [Mycobacteroides abscessus]